mmetsp:Transcript_1527/g.4182  ORF Transcript_1527/g.4182 Transcript_1527/m.4182 type:complete len:230 (+) Transcript_1527:64-753(+)
MAGSSGGGGGGVRHDRMFLSLNKSLANTANIDIDPTATVTSAGAMAATADPHPDWQLGADLPLMDEWSMWEQLQTAGQQPGSRGDNYDNQTNKFATFRTVQHFWRLMEHLPQPSHLVEGKKMVRERADGVHTVDAIMLFKSPIRPKWEDPKNADGGHFQFQIRPRECEPAQIDEYWNNLVLGVVGATIEPHDIITGLRMVDKLQASRTPAAATIRLEVWFTQCDAGQSA